MTLKELLAKKDAGTITDEETKELDEKVEAGEKSEEVEIGDEVVDAVADKAVAKMAPAIEVAVTKAFEAHAEKTEKTISKPVNGGSNEEIANGAPVASVDAKVRFIRGAIGLIKKDEQAVKEYNKFAIEALVKTGYQNETTNADGGYLIALPEFEAEVEKLLPVYGIAFREADVRTISSNKILTNKYGSGVVMNETSEGGLKSTSKLTYAQVEATLRKFAGIVIASDELTEDSAIDFWADVTDDFARERARIADTMVFTENGTVYKGILRKAGTFVETVGAAITSLTWDDLLNAQFKVPTEAAMNGKFYMHRTIWNILLQNKDSQNRYQFNPAMGLFTPWGTPVVLVDAMPTSTDFGDANEPYLAFADLKRVRLYQKRGLRLDTSKEATVHDADNNAVNLFEKNLTALRGEVRMMTLIKFPEAICAIGTGTVS